MSWSLFQDLDLKTLKALVKFMYTDTLDSDSEDVKALFSSADKYDIQVTNV